MISAASVAQSKMSNPDRHLLYYAEWLLRLSASSGGSRHRIKERE
jgi:hypothetical protein